MSREAEQPAHGAPQPPIITLLTDFGFDGAPATCEGVMLAICPHARVVHVSHAVRKFAVSDGAFLLAAALPYMPVGVHVAVIDPGVGTRRRPIGIRTGRGDVLIGPDNGLLLPAADALGGRTAARELTDRALWLPTSSTTFHGRDIFSPVAAHVAAGVEFDRVGTELPVDDLVHVELGKATVADGVLETTVVYVDSFGNVRLAGSRRNLVEAFGNVSDGDPLAVAIGNGEPFHATFAPSFGHVEVGATLVYVDSAGGVALADNQGNFAARVGARTGMPVRIGPA